MSGASDLFHLVTSNVTRRAAELEELWKARIEVDVRGLVAGIRGRLEQRLSLEPLPVPGDLSERPGPMGWGVISTSVWRAPRCRKIALSHVAFSPALDGFAIVVLPEERLAAPVFGADLMALPSRIAVHVDTYGVAELREAAQSALTPLAETFARLQTVSGPARAAHLASGVGLHAKVSLRMIDDAFGAVSSALSRALDVIDAAPEGPGGPATQSEFFNLFKAPSFRTRALSQLLGESWWQRYTHLVFAGDGE